MLYPEKYLKAIVDLQSLLLANADIQTIYNEVSNTLIRVIGAKRVCIYEKDTTSEASVMVLLKAQATPNNHSKENSKENNNNNLIIENDVLYQINLTNMLRDWLRPLLSGIIISGHLGDFEVQWQAILKNLGINSFSFIPITKQGKVSVFVAIFHEHTKYVVQPAEINLFNVIANQFTAFFNRRYTEDKLLSYKKIFEESNLNVFVLDQDGFHLESNFAYRQLIGYDTDEELEGITPQVLFGDSFPVWFEELKTKGYYHGEIEISRIGIILELSSYIVQSEDGTMISYINIATDITKRIESDKDMTALLVNYQKVNETLIANEYELLKSEQQLRMLAENSFEMLSLSTADGVLVYLSASCEKITGYEKEELYGKYLIDFFHPDDLDLIQIQSQEQIINKDKSIIITHRFLTKSGEYIWLESFTQYLYDDEGNIANLQTSSRDVTQNVLANKALKNSEEKFRTLFNKTYDAIFIYRIIDKTYTKFIEANEIACKLLGYERIELLQLSLDSLVLDMQDFPADISHDNRNFQTVFINKKGLKIPVEIAITLIDADNDVVIQLVARDITEKKLADESIKAKEVAEKLLRIKTDFLANMSHEIRTPMNGILGMTHFLLNTPLDEKQQHYAETVKKSAENLLAILNDILDLSKLEASKMRLKPKVFDIRQTIEQLKGLFESVMLQQNIRFVDVWHIDFSSWIVADESRLIQVITNLVSNAIKFTTIGEIKIVISNLKNNTQIGQQTGQQASVFENEMLKIEVIDEGMGISEEHQALLFDKFYQIDSDSNIKQQGTGLGLSICKQFVELWHGEINVTSVVGKGSNFWFTLPLKLATAIEIQEVQQTQLQAKKQQFRFENLYVLVAEDVFVNQEVAKTMAEHIGCVVDVVKNGKEAVEIVATKKYDLILMDIQMPIMNGITATKHIKNTENPPIIIGLSANVMEEDAKKYIAEGMDDYISKPIEPLVLQEKLAKWFPNKIATTPNITENVNEKISQNITSNTELKTEYHMENIITKQVEILNHTSITKLLSLVKNNKNKFDILLNSFDEDMLDLLTHGNQAIDNQDNKELISVIHTIKGIAGTLGTAALYDFVKDFYLRLHEGNFAENNENLAKIKLLYEQASEELHKVSAGLL